jgi:hypothetical protein
MKVALASSARQKAMTFSVREWARAGKSGA